jgi:hypothetical protein
MKKALLIALTLVISFAFVTAVFAQAPAAPPGPRSDTVPPAAPTGEKATKAKKPAKKQSGVKQESTATSAGEKAGKGPAPKAPTGGVKQESTPATK